MHKQHCLAVFFHVEKVCDTAWKFGILRDLAHLGIRGRMLNCLKDFLSTGLLCTSGQNSFKELHPENGVPQGCILSTTLFIVKMNSIASIIPQCIMYSLYVDDHHIACTSSSLQTCERQIQLTLNKLAV